MLSFPPRGKSGRKTAGTIIANTSYIKGGNPGSGREEKMEQILYISLYVSILALASVSGSGDKEKTNALNRENMVKNQIAGRGITDNNTVEAMRKVPRHKFVPDYVRELAYSDTPLLIGMGQTISQPYIVAYMTEVLRPEKGQKILEIGTGSGYQTAILAEIGCEVYTIEIIEALSVYAKNILTELGYKNIHYKIGDGYEGWEMHAPYDGIIVTAAAPEIPEPLIAQLGENGKMVIPVGDDFQNLILLSKTKGGMTKGGIKKESLSPVRFVPMKGEAEKHHR